MWQHNTVQSIHTCLFATAWRTHECCNVAHAHVEQMPLLLLVPSKFPSASGRDKHRVPGLVIAPHSYALRSLAWKFCIPFNSPDGPGHGTRQ